MSDTEWPDSYIIKSRYWIILYVPMTDPALYTEGNPKDNPDDYNLGICRADKNTIWICTDQGPESMRDTLWHELVHACHAYAPMAAPVEDKEDQEENAVLFATESAFEIINNAVSVWWLG